MKTFPKDWRSQEPLMLGAFVGFLTFAVKETDAIDAFQKETGKRLPVNLSAFDRMIDKATGNMNGDVLEAFIQWVYETMWAGSEDKERGE